MKISLILMFILSITLTSFAGCKVNTSLETTSVISTQPTSSTTSTQQFKETPPTKPISVAVSFPDGAPPLNQTKEFRVTVKTNSMPAKAMNVQVNLPDSFELINGTVSWTGDIPVKNEVHVIKAMVKSVITGSYTIEVTSYIDPKEHGFFGGTGHNPVYVFVSENSAEWRLNPPYGPSDTSPLPPGQVPATSYTPNP